VSVLEILGWFLAGVVVSALGVAVRALAARRRRTRRMVAELTRLEQPLLVVGSDGRVRLSAPLADQLGADAAWNDDLDRTAARFVHEPDRARLSDLVRDLRGGTRVSGEAELRLRFGDERLHQVTLQAFRLESCNWGGGLIVATVSDRTRTLQIEEERDRLFNLSLDLLAVGDLSGRLLQVNPAWVRVLRWSRDDIMARTFPDLIHPDDRAGARQALAELRDGAPVRDRELRTLCRDGSFRWVSWSSFPLTARARVFTVARDITERKQAEQQLQRYQQRLQQLANQLATVEERQNRQLAETLHDTLAQELFAAQAKLSLLRYPDRLDDPDAVLQEATGILEHASHLTRTLTFELFPPALYEVGLDAALEWLCRSFRKTRGLACEFHCDHDGPDLAQDVRLLLYQGARELLGNVFKHADASQARLELVCGEQELVLRVDDDGRGFTPADAADGNGDGAPDGFGLFNIRERLTHWSGELTTEPSPLGGARVTLTLPLSGPAR
jgi:PAS domain S-box-containing protein